MDLSQLSVSSATQSIYGAQGTQSTQGHHHHHRPSISNQVSNLSSAINNAVNSGQLTSDQATSMEKELNDITQTLASATQSSSTSTTSQSGSSTNQSGLSQLSDSDRKKVMQELQDVRKQLFQALNPQAAGSASATSNSDQINSLFSAMDTNGDGTIDKSELTNYINQIENSSQGAADAFIGSLYNPQGGATTASSAAVGSSLSVEG